jgi:hypothetical protein
MAPENVIAGEEPRKQQHLVRSSVTGSLHTEPVDQSQGSPASTDCRFGVWLIEMVGMSESVRVLRVVIASPGDVAPERAVVPAVLDDLNLCLANCNSQGTGTEHVRTNRALKDLSRGVERCPQPWEVKEADIEDSLCA